MPVLGFLEMIGPTELIVILVIVLIVFGAGRLPEVFESFGKGIKAFRDAQKTEEPDRTASARRAGELPAHLDAEPETEPEKEAEEVARRTGSA